MPMYNYSFKMPSLGADMDEGTITKWHIQPGDEVKRGDIVVSVETAKGVIEVEIWQSGKVAEILVPVYEKVAVGTTIAILHISEPVEEEQSEVPSPQEKLAAVETPAIKEATPQPSQRVRSSPAARKLARELNINLANVEGTGPHGIIQRKDVEKTAQSKAPKEAKTDGKTLMRDAIANAMSKSKREIPHYYLGHKINIDKALKWLEKENLERPLTERLLYSVLLIKAVAKALKKVPELNGFYTDKTFQQGTGIHVGMAISLRGGGLVAPALIDTDKKDLTTLMTEFRDLVKRARSGKLRGSEMTQATITITNLGEQGVDIVYGVIYPPQVALVGFGKIQQQLTLVDDKVVSEANIHISLAADHRISDGHRGGLFLLEVEKLLQSPEEL